MALNRVADKYAATFLSLISEAHADSNVAADMQFITDAIKEVVQLRRILENPTVNPELKGKLIIAIFEGKIAEQTIAAVKFLVSKRRIELIGAVAQSYIRLRNIKLGRIAVKVSSVVPLSGEQFEEIKKFLEQKYSKTVTMTNAIDENLLGGFVAEIGDTVIDASLKNKLRNVKSKLLNSTIPLN
ncbi:MAG: hypothetical protein AMXMBFR48_13890 [Ignavibacteriales bacterium]